MATIRKRGNSWQVQIRKTGTDATSASFSSEQAACAWAHEKESGRDEYPNLAGLLDKYQLTVSLHKKEYKTECWRIVVIKRHPISRIPLRILNAKDMSTYRDDRLKLVKPDTLLREMCTIRTCIDIAVKEWGVKLDTNPAKGLRLPQQGSPRTERLTASQVIRLKEGFAGSPTWFLKPIVLLAIETAMRRGELLSLRWSNVDLRKGTAHLPVTKNGHSRTVALSPEAIMILDALERKDSRVFPLNISQVHNGWINLRRRAKLEHLRFHDLRHEAISRLFELGLSIPEVAMQSGHKDYKMLERYTHLRPEDVASKIRDLTQKI
jgi:integrase